MNVFLLDVRSCYRSEGLKIREPAAIFLLFQPFKWRGVLEKNATLVPSRPFSESFLAVSRRAEAEFLR